MEEGTKKSGSLLGGILLVSGCCIGAGMLGLPVLSAMAGWQPSVVMFFLSWLFMTCTGLLLLEVNLWFTEEVSIVTMAERTLGAFGKIVAWLVFLFLFYCLMVAYISGSGELFVDFFQQLTGIALPAWVGSLAFIAVLAILLFLGTLAVDRFNRILMLGLIVSYLALVAVGCLCVNPELLKHRDWSMATYVLPAMIVSFGFHNLVPSLTTYLKRDAKRLRLTLIIGSIIPLFIYLVWEWLILGLIPMEGSGGFIDALDNGFMATQALKSAVGSAWVVDFAQYFAFFAIVTSFVGVALSFVDFLADGLNVKKTPKGKIVLCFLVLFPPFVFAAIYPKVFLIALGYAGGYGAVILFGILPALMAWSGRYYKNLNIGHGQMIPGGKWTLALLILISCTIIGVQIVHEF